MRWLLVLPVLALPALAQETEPGSRSDGPSLTDRGLRLFLDGLMEEMEPALRDLEGFAKDAAPLLQQLQERLGAVVGDLDVYDPPEIMPNGDIIIRRKEPLPEDVIENPDGSIDL